MTVGVGPFTYDIVPGWGQLLAGWQWEHVVGVAVDSRDRVYVFYRSERPVMVFDRDGAFLTTWGEGVFTRPHGLTIGPDDCVYCADDKDHTVRKFTPDGALLRTWGTKGVPSHTGYDGKNRATITHGGPPFNRPTNVGFAPTGEMYVSDGYGNTRVHQFAADGRLLLSWGEPGSGPGQFNVVHSVSVDGAGRVLVADRENNRVQIFSPDGEFLAQWTGLNRPEEIDFDAEGAIYVAEGFSQISVFAPDGGHLARWGRTNGPGKRRKSSHQIHTLAVDSGGDIYVASQSYQETGFLKKFARR
ncbi:MAG: hypothetical protein KIT87_20365 [Anaerolineae bacterium]|nr:hypothetical protein [Anaerolineae bacterium]